MENHNFELYKDRIRQALDKKLKSSTGLFSGESDYVLIEGFFNQSFQKEISGNFVVGGPVLPMVAIVGSTTGRITFFALKALLPDIKI